MSEKLINTLKKDEGLLKRATHIKTQSGKREKNLTLGYGYNLTAQAKKAKSDLIEAGVDEDLVADVMSGKAEINEAQANKLLVIATKRATQDAYRVVPTLDKLPEDVRNVVIGMSYQMGPTKLRGFKNFRDALYSKDYEKAAAEVLDSDLAREDATARANRHAKVLREAAKKAKEVKTKPIVDSPFPSRAEEVKRELLFKKAVAVRQAAPDPTIPRLAGLFAKMQAPVVEQTNNSDVTEEVTE